MEHLHIHSMYSLLDSIIKPNEYIEKMKELGKKAVCFTEHGNLYSAVETYKRCKEEGLKFISACEFYICDDVNVRDRKRKYFHLNVFAKNEVGRLNLIQLVTKSQEYLYYKKPRIDYDMLLEHKEGLVISSACIGGEIMKALQRDDYIEAMNVANKYKKDFGDDFYIEVQSHRVVEQAKLNRKIIDLANELNIKYIVTTDAHYLNEEEEPYHRVFVKVNQNRDTEEFYKDCFVQTDEQVIEFTTQPFTETKIIDGTECHFEVDSSDLLSIEEIKLAMKNTEEIVDKCNVEIPLSEPIMPHINIPSEFKDEVHYLQYLCTKGWVNKEIHLKPNQDEYKERLQFEINAISQMGFAGYYLLVESYASSVERRGIARGSGGGTLVGYLTGIVDIDPIEHGLYFERFIDVGALKLLKDGKITKSELKIPDFDLDFGKEDRIKIINLLKDRYGSEKVTAIGTFQYMKAKASIKDIGRVLGVPYDYTNKITKNMEDGITIKEAIDLGMLDEYKDEYPLLFEYASYLAGLPKSFGQHPCGFIVSMNDANYYGATELNDEGHNVFQFDMHSAEDMGLVKIDILGLKTVDIIYDTLELIGKDYNYIAPHKLNFNDAKVYKEFRNAHTDGVFQFESDGMKSTLKSIAVDSLHDLTIANALYRPSSKEFIPNYAKRKAGLEEFEYIHTDLKPILENTYGIIVFQEQLIEIGRLAELDNPDLLRKATAKKDVELMAKIRPELEHGLVIGRGWDSEQVDVLWDIMLDFAKYSFNKSHSSAYGIIAYICMYLKVYHPKEFLVSWINANNGDIDTIRGCIAECKRMNVPITVPTYHNLKAKTSLDDESILIGSESIKYLNQKIANEIKSLSKNKYNNFLDLYLDINEHTSANKKHIDILIKLGAFRDFGDANYLLKVVELAQWTSKKQINKAKVDDSPFSLDVLLKNGTATAKMIKVDFKKAIIDTMDSIEYTPSTLMDTIKWEAEYLGYATKTIPQAKDNTCIVLKKEVTKWKSVNVTLYQLKTGNITQLRVDSKSLHKLSIDNFDIIDLTGFYTTKNGYKVLSKWCQYK